MPRTFKARPTTDFAKENLFNVLSNQIDFEDGVTALDLFAGTGSISIELVSRGCDKVISVEKDSQHYAFICKVMQEVKTDKCFPIRGDAFPGALASASWCIKKVIAWARRSFQTAARAASGQRA